MLCVCVRACFDCFLDSTGFAVAFGMVLKVRALQRQQGPALVIWF